MVGDIQTKIKVTALVALMATVVQVSAVERLSPEEWLQKMSSAVQTLDYEGTVIRQQNGKLQPLRVVHKMIDGVVNERIIVQEGNGLEVIRVGDEVHCILPDKRSVLIDHWENASTLFATLPTSKVNPGVQYDVLILGYHERVAGRRVVNIAIRPNDGYRFEHRFWLDQRTGFPLQTQLIDGTGVIIDQLKFAAITIDTPISARLLAPSMSLDSYTWYTRPSKPEPAEVHTDWVSDSLPAGFKVVSTSQEVFSGSDREVTHIVYGDGMTSVSVFIAAMQDEEIQQRAQRGLSSSYSTEIDGYQITAVGEVPPETVRVIATSMQRR